MKAVAKVEPQALPAPIVSESLAILQVVERAASNKDVDIDKLERLLLMHERIKAREAAAAYADALARMQAELPIIGERGGIKDRNGNIQSHYALWEDVVGQITPVLSRHGFGLSFRVTNDAQGVTVTGVLSHALGHSEQTSLMLPIDTSGSKNAVQSVGSSTSYGKRYTAGCLLNLRSGATEDDDGTGPQPVEPDGFADWWTALQEAANFGSKELERVWTHADAPKSFRAYVVKNLASQWTALKALSQKVAA